LLNARQLGAFAIEKNAPAQFLGQGRVPYSIEGDLVFLFNLEPRMSELLSEIAVTRQKKQSFTLRIQATDTEEAGKIFRQQIVNRVGRVRIAPGRNEANWFVQENGQWRLWPNESAIDFDVIAFVNLGAEVSRRLAVNRYPPGGDQLITMSSGTEPGRCKKAIEAHEMEKME